MPAGSPTSGAEHSTGTVSVSPPDADLRPPPDPVAICAEYKRSLRTDAPGDWSPDERGWEESTWDGTSVECKVVKKYQVITQEYWDAPTCCPTGDKVRPTCGPAVKVTRTGYTLVITQASLTRDGGVTYAFDRTDAQDPEPPPQYNCGRRPEGLCIDVELCPENDAVGAELARMAELEAASIWAFERLARELAAHGAHETLVQQARRALRDEIRHAQVMTACARQFGVVPRRIHAPTLPVRSLVAIAVENATEGCVREAYGALAATVQATRAAPALRDAFAAIARDERRHAALAEAVHEWIMALLSPPERAEVELARTRARGELRASLSNATAPLALGLPTVDEAHALCDLYFTADNSLKPGATLSRRGGNTGAPPRDIPGHGRDPS